MSTAREAFAHAWSEYVQNADDREWHDLELPSPLGTPGVDWRPIVNALPSDVREASLFWGNVVCDRYSGQVLRAGGGYCVWATNAGSWHPVEFFDADGRATGAAKVNDGDARVHDVDGPAQRAELDPLHVVAGPRGSIRGTLLREGSPVRDVLVVLLHQPTMGGRGDLTDASGRFELCGLPPGQFKLSATDRIKSALWHATVSAEQGDADVTLVLTTRAK